MVRKPHKLMDGGQAAGGAEDQTPDRNGTGNSDPSPPRKRRCVVEDRHQDVLSPEEWRRMLYEPLNAQKKDIRLLKVHPKQSPRDDLEASMHTIPLEHASFAAISYVWGDSKRQKKIILNDHAISVGHSAYAALRHTGYKDTNQHIWIDALCINQSDKEERSQQVSLMGEVYGKAEPVWLWTGGYTKDTETLANLMNRLAFMRDPSKSDFDFDSRDGRILVGLSSTEWLSLAAVLRSPFWHRVWILQEIIMGAARGQAIVLFGRFWMQYDTLAKLVRALVKAAVFLVQSDPGELHSEVLDVMVNGIVFHRHMGILDAFESGTCDSIDALDFNTILDATDPRDRVYGLMGLIRSLRIRPDYNKSISQVYRETTVATLEQAVSLNGLTRCGANNNAGSGLPSWAFNWDNKIKHHGLSKILEAQSKLYNACAGHAADFSACGSRLSVRGCKLMDVDGFVQYHSEYLVDHPLTNLAFVRQWMLRRVQENPRVRDHGFSEAFKRAILLDEAISARYNTGVRIGPTTRLDDIKPLLDVEHFFDLIDRMAAGQTPDADDERDTLSCINNFASHLPDAKLTIGPGGECCILHPGVEKGDGIFVLAGCSVPLALRPVRDVTGQLQLVGPAYVHGAMDGEAVIGSAKRVSTGDPDAYDDAFEEIVLV
ncbi:hypothetical protein LTR37_013993 [Vermiconidia calcicola]|uniref:Uncharacterized protein n=1 Tax=Vermiconidia calcicola TaxID=1690605 RepID=A0ACC3MVX2_9PEZI|nr:hypothetical protein LTR37_013993 [Vermiconidia calcicola]